MTRASMSNASPRLRRPPNPLSCLLLGLACVSTGCAAFTNPVANGVPVRIVPDEVLGVSREGYEPIDLARLRAEPPEEFLLDSGDTLGIYIEGIIGDETVPPPVNLPSSSDLPPAIGYPFPLRSDGSISLPLAGSIQLSGMTIEEAEQAVVDAYLDKQIIREEDFRIIVTLLRPRTVRVLVVREDGRTGGITVQNEGLRGLGSTSTTIGGGQNPTGNELDLPVYENDLLNALATTGGVPNNAVTPEVVIYRGYVSADSLADCLPCQLPNADAGELDDGRRVIRVPLRKKCGTRVSIPRDDIVLQDGDIVTLRAREPEFFYTAGLLPSGEAQLPFDYDLNVVEAVLRTRGPLINGGLNSSNLNGAIVGGGLGNPSPSLLSVLRRLPGGQQINIMVDLNEALRDPRQNIRVQPNDVLVLQENRDEALSRYFYNNVFRVDTFFRFINHQDGQASASFVLP